MEKWKDKLLYTLAGTSSGLTGLVSSSQCSGSSCPSCFKCVGVGATVILLLLYNKHKERREGLNGEDRKPVASSEFF
jgi:hypothetical protein